MYQNFKMQLKNYHWGDLFQCVLWFQKFRNDLYRDQKLLLQFKKVFWIHWPQVSKLFHAHEKCTQVLGSLLWWLTALLQGLILLTFTWSSEDHMHFSLFRRYMYFIVAIKFAKLCMENVSVQLLLSLLFTHSLSLPLSRKIERIMCGLSIILLYTKKMSEKFCKGIFKVNQILWLVQKMLAQLFPFKLRMHWKKII